MFEPFEGTSSLSHHVEPAVLAALPRDRWLLASLLQKAIRRGRTDYATAASALLAELVPEYVARRLPVIAYEDVGVAAPNLLVWVKHAAASLPCLPVDDRCEVSARIAYRLAESVKSRTACDIVSLLEASDETLSHARSLTRDTTGDWIAVAADRQQLLLRRAVALRFALGLGVRGVRPSARSGERAHTLPALATAMQLPASVVAAVHAGTQTHNLNAALPLAHDILNSGEQPTIKTQTRCSASTAESHGLLLCAVDMFTRCGRNAYRLLAGAERDAIRVLGKVDSDVDVSNAIGVLLFHGEGSLLNRALVSSASLELLAEVETQEARQAGLTGDRDAKALRLWLRRNVELVDRCRIAALATYLRPAAKEPT